MCQHDFAKTEEIFVRVCPAIYARLQHRGRAEETFINGVRPRVGESGFGMITGCAYTAPYEDITLKSN
jgi:hypothetical protein